ncbi:galactosylceramide sulfotransferase-like [Antedon mediterranea]|uniref:galactosylceramide sulfotransferase-like n=1 Tax=Antedon mediterranea TaxID=105859 RepID=UPI003AF45BC9
MPSDSFYVTIIREPVSVFHSYFGYFGWKKKFELQNYSNPIEEFMNRMETFDVIPESYKTRRDVVFHHFDYKQNIETDTMAKMVMANMERELDFVMLLEYLDESLILLKNKLCWSFEDILYVPKLVRSQRFAINESLANRIRKWSRWDVILYDRFNTSFWKQVDTFGLDKMKRELKIFKEKQKELRENCTDEKDNNISKVKNMKFKSHIEKDGFCWKIQRSETNYTRHLREKQRKFYNQTKKIT